MLLNFSEINKNSFDFRFDRILTVLENTSVSSRWREINLDPRDWCLAILRRMWLCLFSFGVCGRSSLCIINNGTSTDVCHQFGEEKSKTTERQTDSAREGLFGKDDGSL